MRVLVTGGRNYQNRRKVFEKLALMHEEQPITLIIHGACCEKEDKTQLRGADRWAQEWAQLNEVAYLGVPAEWMKFGESAGPRRNADMGAMKPDYVFAFPGGNGTKNMIDEARLQGIEVRKIKE